MTVRLPPVLRTVMNGATGLDGEGATVGEVLESLARAHPALGLHLLDEAGRPRRNIICLHDGEVVRSFEFAARAVREGDELVMTNILAGG
ncbi:MAG TPA: MoaD/ThiS family protein [Rhizomicrobium sp.]|nr:MoaD/ThiS family protein [Rhizomicrobium sp.]